MPKVIASGACPTFFKAWCHEASAPGSIGYFGVGRAIASKVVELADYGAPDREWVEEVKQLNALVPTIDVAQRNREKVLQWFDGHLPKCMALIPAERRERFLDGFEHAIFVDEVDPLSC